MNNVVEDVVITDLASLKKAITPFEINGKPRELLLRGIEELRAAYSDYVMALSSLGESETEMGGFAPAKPSDPLTGRHWVDDIIKRRLGGVRDKLMVCWKIGTESYIWNPVDKTLTNAS